MHPSGSLNTWNLFHTPLQTCGSHRLLLFPFSVFSFKLFNVYKITQFEHVKQNMTLSSAEYKWRTVNSLAQLNTIREPLID
jgi:hypothetical protein